MNSQVKQANAVSRNDGVSVSPTSREDDMLTERTELIDVRKKAWWLQRNEDRPMPSKNKLGKNDSYDIKKMKKANGIDKELAAIASSLDKEAAATASRNAPSSFTESSSSEFGASTYSRSMLRPTAHGKAMKEGLEIRSRKFRRLQVLSEEIKTSSVHNEEQQKELSIDSLFSRDKDEINESNHKGVNDDAAKIEARFQDSVRSLDCEKPEPLFSLPLESPMRQSYQSPPPATPAKYRTKFWATSKSTNTANTDSPSHTTGDEEDGSASDSESSHCSRSSTSSDESVSSDSSSCSQTEAISTRSSSHAEHSSVISEDVSPGTNAYKPSVVASLRPSLVRGLSFESDEVVALPESVEQEAKDESPKSKEVQVTNTGFKPYCMRPQLVRGLSFDSPIEPPPLCSEDSSSDRDSDDDDDDDDSEDDSEDELKTPPNVTIVLRSAMPRNVSPKPKPAVNQIPFRPRRAGRRPGHLTIKEDSSYNSESDDDSFCDESAYETLRMNKPKKFRRQPGSFQLRRVTRKPVARGTAVGTQCIIRGESFRVPAAPRKMLRRPTLENAGHLSSVPEEETSGNDAFQKPKVLRRPTVENVLAPAGAPVPSKNAKNKPFGKKNAKATIRPLLLAKSTPSFTSESETPPRDTTTTKNTNAVISGTNDLERVASKLKSENQNNNNSSPKPIVRPRRASIGHSNDSSQNDLEKSRSNSDKPAWAEAQLKPTGQKEKLQKAGGNLAKPITFPLKPVESSKPGPVYNRSVLLRTTPHGQAMKQGNAILSRKARRLQELNTILQQEEEER